MALFNRDGQPLAEKRWPLLLLTLAIALFIAVGVVFGARWIYRSVTNDEAEPQPVATNPQPEPAPPASPQAPPQSGTPKSSQNPLPGSGPGDVVALFIGTSAIAAALHFIVRLRRSNNFS